MRKVYLPTSSQSSELPKTSSPRCLSVAQTVLTNSSIPSSHDSPIPVRATAWLAITLRFVTSMISADASSGKNRISQGR